MDYSGRPPALAWDQPNMCRDLVPAGCTGLVPKATGKKRKTGNGGDGNSFPLSVVSTKKQKKPSKTVCTDLYPTGDIYIFQ